MPKVEVPKVVVPKLGRARVELSSPRPELPQAVGAKLEVPRPELPKSLNPNPEVVRVVVGI